MRHPLLDKNPLSYFPQGGKDCLCSFPPGGRLGRGYLMIYSLLSVFAASIFVAINAGTQLLSIHKTGKSTIV